MEKIEQAIFASTKVNIKNTYSGGAYFSYSQGMEPLIEIIGAKMNGYITTIDFASQVQTVDDYKRMMPSKLAYGQFKMDGEDVFSFSIIHPARDFGTSAANGHGREGSKLSHIIAGPANKINNYPVIYMDCNIFRNVPFQEKDFTGNVQPGYMDSYEEIQGGNYMSRENVVNRLIKISGAKEIVKELFYAVLSQESIDGPIKPLVICAEKNQIIDWIAALQYLLPVSYAKKLTFSTYEYNPYGKNSDFRIIGAYPKGTRYDELGKEKPLIIYDMVNEGRSTKINEISIELSNFLVEGIFNDSKYLGVLEFHNFLNAFSEVILSTKLEAVYHLYRIIERREEIEISTEEMQQIQSFVCSCRVPELDTKITKYILKLFTNFTSYDEVCEGYLLHKIREGLLDKRVIENALIDYMRQVMRLQISTVNQEFLMDKQAKFNQLTSKLGDNFILLFSEDSIKHYQNYFIYSGANEVVDYEMFLRRNVFVLSDIITYMNFKGISKKQLLLDGSIYKTIFQMVSKNVLSSSFSIEEKKEFLDSFSKRLEDDALVFLNCNRFWGNYMETTLQEYLTDIRKAYAAKYRGDRKQLYVEFCRAGYSADVVEILKKINVEINGIDKAIENIEVVYQYIIKDIEGIINEYFRNIRSNTSMILLYNFAAEKRVYSKEQLQQLEESIVSNMPLVKQSPVEVTFIKMQANRIEKPQSARYELIRALIELHEISSDSKKLQELKKYGNIDWMKKGIQADVSQIGNELQAYSKEYASMLFQLFEKTENPAILIEGAFIVDNANTVEDILNQELFELLSADYRKKQKNYPYILNSYVVERIARANNICFSEKQMASCFMDYKIKGERIITTCIDTTESVLKARKKRAAGQLLTVQEINDYWKTVLKVYSQMEEERSGIGKIFNGLFKKRK